MSHILNLEEEAAPQISLVNVKKFSPVGAQLTDGDYHSGGGDFTSPIMRRDMNMIIEDFSPNN